MMMQRISLVFFSLIVLSACSQVPDEEAINQRIDNILAGLNSKDSGLVLNQLSPNFTGAHNLDRQNARRMMAVYFLRYKSVDVVLSHRKTSINGVTATTSGTALLVGREQLLPESGRLIPLSAQWDKSDGEWLLRKLEWE